ELRRDLPVKLPRPRRRASPLNETLTRLSHQFYFTWRWSADEENLNELEEHVKKRSWGVTSSVVLAVMLVTAASARAQRWDEKIKALEQELSPPKSHPM